MRDRDFEIDFIRGTASADRVSVKDNGITQLSSPSPTNLIDEFIRRTGDGEIRQVVIDDADREAREEAVDGVAYTIWRVIYGGGSPYSNQLRSQAAAKFVSAFHLLWMAEQADEE
mgnify:CR=1 FL=1